MHLRFKLYLTITPNISREFTRSKMPTGVHLYIYDMSMGMAAQLSPLFLGITIVLQS